MRNITFSDYSLDGLIDLQEQELVETNGGFLPLLILGAVLLLSSCGSGNGNNVVVGGSNNSQTQINITVKKGDTLIVKGDTLIVK